MVHTTLCGHVLEITVYAIIAFPVIIKLLLFWDDNETAIIFTVIRRDTITTYVRFDAGSVLTATQTLNMIL